MKMHYTIILVTFFFLGMSQAFAQNGTATLTIDVEPAETVTAGEAIPGDNGGGPTVLFESDNSVENKTVTVTLNGPADFASGTVTQTTDSEGKAEFDDLEINTVGTYSMVFDIGVASVTSREFDVQVADASEIKIEIQPQDAIAGEVINKDSDDIEVHLKDAYDNSIPDEAIEVEIGGDHAATLSGTTTVTTDDSGNAVFDDLVIEKTGIYTLVFKVGTVSSSSQEFEIVAADPDELVIFDQPADTKAGIVITGKNIYPRVRVYDIYGNLTPGVTIKLATDCGYDFDAGTVTGTTNSNGAAVFNDLVIETAGEYKMAFSLTDETLNVDEVTSDPFDIFSAEADSFNVDVEDITAGEEAIIDIFDAKDAFDNELDGDYEANIAIPDNGEKYNETKTLTFTAGTASYTTSDTFETAGTYTATVEVDETEKSTSFEIVHSDVVDQINVEVDNITAGDKAILVLEIKDAFDNPISGDYLTDITIGNATEIYSSTQTITYTDGSFDYETAEMLTEAGSRTATVIIEEKTATDTFEISPKDDYDLAKSTVEAEPQELVVGTKTSVITVTLKDEFGNQLGSGGENIEVVEPESTVSGVVDNENGTYTATISSEKAGTRDVTAFLYEGGQSFTVGTTTITYLPAAADAGQSEITADPVDGLVADGEDASAITVFLKDEFGNDLTDGGNVTVTMSSDEGEVTDPVDQEDGTYMATLTSTTAGSITVTANLEGYTKAEKIGTVSVTFLSGLPVAEKSSVEASPDKVTADGVSPSEITITVKDKNDNTVEHVDVYFDIIEGTATMSDGPWQTDETGEAVATLTSTVANMVTVKGYLGQDAQGEFIGQQTITFEAGDPVAENSDIVLDEEKVFANGNDEAEIVVVLLDEFGNPVPDEEVLFTVSPTFAEFDNDTPTTDEEGRAIARLTATDTGTVTVEASIGGDTKGDTIGSVSVTFVDENITVDADSLEIIADDTSTSLITVTVEDLDNESVAGVSVTVTTDKGSWNGGSQEEIVFTDDTGTATLTLTSSTDAGTATILADHAETTADEVQVEFLPGEADTFVVSVDDIFRSEEATVEVMDAVDSEDNLLSGTYTGTVTIENDEETYENATVTFTFTDGESQYITDGLTDIPGTYSVSVVIDGVDANTTFEIEQPELRFAFNDQPADPGDSFLYSSEDVIVMSLEEVIKGSHPFEIDVEIKSAVYTDVFSVTVSENEDIFNETLAGGTYTVVVTSITDDDGFSVLNPEESYVYHVDVGYTLGFEIEDEAGDPIEHAEVELDDVGVSTDTWVFEKLVPDSYTYTVSAEGYNPVNGNTEVTGNMTETVTLGLKTYTITATSGNNGEIDPNGDVVVTHGDDITFTITPDTNYSFDELVVDGNPVEPTTLTPTITYTFENVTSDDHTIHASFDLNEYTILAESEGGGQIDPAGTVTVTHGDNQNFEFEPDTGHFIDDVLVDEISIGTPSSYLFTNVTKDHGITAKFGIHTYTITAESGDNGSIDPVEAVVDYGGTVTFTLSPDEGYEVNEIVVGGVTQTFEGETFILEDIQEDQHVYVSFTKKTFEITVTSGTNGTIIPEGEDGIVIVEYGDNQTFDIVPDEGYHTTELIIDDVTIPPQNRYTFTNVQEDGSIEATFEINEYLLTYIAGDNGSINDVGIITQTVTHGENGPEVEANPDDDYQFVQWSDGVTDNPRTDTDVQGPIEVTAIFAEIGEYSIMANVEPVGAGTVSGTGSYNPDDQVSLTASPNPGYEFVEWTGDIQHLDDANLADATVTMPSDNVSLTANFALFTYDINATVVPDESGTVTGTGTYNHFETVILEATPAEGYHFTGWYENGDMLSANSIYIFEAEEDREDIEAHFAKNQYEIQAQAMPSAGGTVTGTGTYEHGETVILDATPEPGYSFVEWTEEGDPIANATETYTFIAEADRSLTAHFELKQIEITAEAEPAIGGTVTGTGSFSFGEEVTLEASPEEGYAFKEWTVNGNQLSTDMVYTFIAEEDLHVTAHFELKTYTISVDIDPVEGGSVSLDDGSFDDGIFDLLHGESLTFFAIPESSYTFVGWYEVTDEDEEFITASPLYKHTASGDDAGDKHFIARFSEDDYNITADASPVEGGTVTGTGTYGHGADVTLEALPSTGYHFKYWTEGGVIIQTEGNDYTFTATQDRHLTAHFELNDYEIAADLEPEEGGTVSGTGTYTHGDQVTLEVEVNEGYDFAGWFEGEELLSEDETYTFTAEENRTLTAKFDIHTHTINGEPVPFAGGTIEGTGTYDYGTEVTMTATPNTGYHFLYWTHQGEVVSEDEEYVFTITESKYLLAHFALNIYTIDAVANPEDGGEIVGAGNYTHGEEVTLEAVPNTGFYFVNWMENGEEIIADDNGSVTETYTFTAESDRDLTAHFDIFTYDINASADPVAGGTVSGSGTYDHGEEVTMEANPETGYQFVEWTIDGVQVSTDMTYAFTAEEDVDLTAHFELKTYTISAIADPEDGGTVTGTGTYQHGETVTLEALPATGYEFVEWTANGEWTHSDSEYTFTAEQDRDLTAHFQLKVYAIDAAADPADGGTVTGAGDYAHGQEVTLTAAPEEGYYFVEWTEDDAHVSDDEIYTFDAEEDRSLTAHFEKFEYVITATADPLEAGTISGTGTYEHGEEVTLTATSESAYQFIDWTEDDTVVGTDSVISFIAADNRDLVANFEVNIYTIQATSSQGGSINPEGDIEVVHGDNQNFTFEADAGYHLEDILVDGNSVGDESFYLFLNVTSNHTIHAVFALNTYTLTYGTDGNGTLTGDTEQQVDHGGNGSPVTAVPNDGYHFTEWSDGVTDNPRTDMDVTGDIDVIAFFDINTYTLEYDTDGNGSISGEATQTVGHGDDGTPVEAVADEGYHFVEWSDGVTDNPRTDTDVTGDLSVTALFALNTYTITSSAGENGTISPLGETAVTHGDDQSYSIIPDTGYEVQELLVDGDPVDAVEDYTFENVTDDHTIHAEFQLTSYTITATSSEGGSIDPEGEVEVTHGTNQQFQFIPDTGYHIDDVTIDGTSIGDESAYTFQNVTNNHTIHAAFAINVYTLQYEAGDNGSIIGDTEQTVEHGNDAAPVEAIPDEGYHFVEWSDGVTENPRIDTDVTGNIAVTAEFAMSTYMLTFHVVNEDGNEIMDATITLDDEVFGAGQYQFDDMPAGEYDYVVSRGGYFDSEGSVEITDEDVTEEVVLVRDDTSLPDIEHIEVEAYPNPANEHLIITSDINMEAIRMVDVLGKIVYDVAVNDDHHEINVSGYKPGLYFVQVSAAGGTRTIRVQVNTN